MGKDKRARLIEVDVENTRRFATLNVAPGVQVYGERIIKVEGVEYRVWDPFRSKLAAALSKGLKQLPIAEGSKLLYLGASTGTTASHVSDLIGETGTLFAVEFAPRVAREFIERVAKHRANVIPIVEDARRVERYGVLYSKVDILYCDIAQPDQTDIAILNCNYYLKPNGYLLLAVKARSINVAEEPRKIFEEETSKLRGAGFRIIQVLKLEPYDKDHAMIIAQMASSNP